MSETISEGIVQGAEWVIPATLYADGVLFVGSFTISAEIIIAATGATILSLTTGNGGIDPNPTADAITFRVTEAQTAADAASPIPLGCRSKLKVTVVDSANVTSIISAWLQVSRDGDAA